MLAPHPPGGTHHRGYSGLGLEKVSQHVFDESTIAALRQVPDVKESYETGNTTDERQPNIWLPDDKLPGFREYMEDFFQVRKTFPPSPDSLLPAYTHNQDCAQMIHTLLRALALALPPPPSTAAADPETHLSTAHATSPFQLRLLHYPPLPRAALAAAHASRIGAHSDFGTLTLLFQDAVGGLEIEDPLHAPPGTFRPAPPVPGAVLVNVGDLMERWSNGRWRSTVHRVGAPPEGKGEMCAARYSIPFFAAPDPEAVIEALPGCWGEGRPKRFEPVTAAGYVEMRMKALYS